MEPHVYFMIAAIPFAVGLFAGYFLGLHDCKAAVKEALDEIRE